MIFFSRVMLFIFLMSSASCWGPSKRKETLLNGFKGKKYAKATFRVAEVQNSAAVPVLTKGVWKVPRSLRYQFKIKVVSQKDARAVIGHEFYIKTESGKVIKEITKASGWLEWHEDVAFNFFSNHPSYLVLKREIVGRDLHQGSYIVDLAVNPWAVFRSKHPNFIYLDKKNRIPVSLLSSGFKQIQQSKIGLKKNITSHYPLDIANAKLFISQLQSYNNAQSLEIKLEMNLLAKLKDTYGESILYKLKSGQVRAFASLMATNLGKENKEYAVLLHSEKPLFVQFTSQDKAVISYKGTLYNQFHKGNLAIAIRLIPEGVSLAPFDALYSLGSYRKIYGLHSLILEKNSSTKQLSSNGKLFSYSKFLEKSSNIKDLKKKRYLQGIRPFRIERARVFHQGVLPGETAIVRTVGFRTKICIKHSWTGAPVINEHFIVNFESKKLKKGSYYTDDQGCLSLVATVSHKIYKPQKYFIKNFHLYHDPNHEFINKNNELKSKKYKKFHQQVSVYINPWDERIGNFGSDVRNTSREYINGIANQKRIPSKFFIQNFSYNTLGFKYTVDDYLNLEIRKRLQLVLQPYVLRYHSVSFGREEFHRTLRDGVYLMKVAFQKTYLKPAAPGVTISPLRDKKEQERRVQSVIEKVPLEKRQALQSVISDLERPNKVFLNMSVSGISAEELASMDVGDFLLSSNKPQPLQSVSSAVRAEEYITVYQKLIKVQNGLIIEHVALNMNNPILMKIRGQLLIQLETVDEKLLQLARLGDLKISKQAQDFLNKTLGRKETWTDLKMIRHLSNSANSEEKIKKLKRFVSKKQDKLTQLIKLLKKRSESFKHKSKDHIDFKTVSAELKTLLDEFSFMQGDFNEIEKNSFVNIKGKSVLDPNMFVAKDSGLAKRTFIAPVTLVAYDNSSYMRPTDSLLLNSCGKGDCLISNTQANSSLSTSKLINQAELISKTGQRSKLTHEYFEHENRLEGINVDDLIARQKSLYKKNQAIKRKESSLAFYTQLYGLDYVSKYSMLKKSDPCFKSTNFSDKCNVKLQADNLSKRSVDMGLKQMTLSTFQEQLNKPFSSWKKFRYKITHFLDDLSPVTEKDIQDLLDTGKIKKSSVKARLCNYIANRLSHSQLVEFNLSKYINSITKEERNKKRELLNSFSKERLRGSSFLCTSAELANNDLKTSSFYKVYKVDSGSSFYKEGQSFNVNVGTNFSLRQSFMTRMDFNPLADPAKLLGITGLSGSPYRMGFSKGTENSFSLTSQVLLSIQESVVSMNIQAYKKCTVVHLTNISRGVVLCGALQTAKKRLSEQYYYISQHFTPGDQLDMGALYNHPWLIRVRGARDILVFLNALRKDTGADWRSIIDFKSSKPGSSVANPFTSVVNDPLSVLKSIKSSYSSFLPGFPGHYQILD